MDPKIKHIQLVPGKGSEEDQDQDGTRKRGRRKPKTFKIGMITKEGGGGTSPGTMTQLAASQLPGTLSVATVPVVGRNSALTQIGAPVSSVGIQAPASVGMQASVQAAGAPVKVVLAAAKKKKGVLLAAAKPEIGRAHV